MQTLRWDIFCRVIDNFGDIGVCWRLASALAGRGQQVRLWVDDASALAWMAPEGCAGVQVMHWQPDQAMGYEHLPGDVVIEAFGCELDQAWIAMKNRAPHADPVWSEGIKALKKPVWINLEYLSAQAYAQRCHGLASPVLHGAAQGLEKWFYYPGFTQGTGGLIREPFAVVSENEPELAQAKPLASVSLFCYEPPALPQLLLQLAAQPQRVMLLAMQGRSESACKAAFQSQNEHFPNWNVRESLSIQEQAYLSQMQYDALLRGCDLNFVRGEDSLVRALWAGRAFVWQIYPQDDGAHADKLQAFLDWLQAPPDLREFHWVWNGLSPAALPAIDLARWTACAQAARVRLLAQPDLVSQLLDFVEEKRNRAACA
jgi:uncharacterized repeat protein (TIGR03837 family)